MYFTSLIKKGISIKAIKTKKRVNLAIGYRFVSIQFRCFFQDNISRMLI